MSIWYIIGIVIIVAIIWNKVMGDDKARLFRRLWSSECAGIRAKQREAMDALIAMYRIKSVEDTEALLYSTTQLRADAIAFDLAHPRNAGVFITPIVTRELKMRFPSLVFEEDRIGSGAD